MSPDFIIIGAMKSGTTTLAAQLGAQDGIFMSVPKEPNYFSDDDMFARGPGWYAALFDAAAPGDLTGEASTHYTKLPTYPDTIARALDVLEAPKLVYMIRNPVDRAVSHYHHEWGQGNVTDDMEAEFAAHPEFIEYGCYARQLKPWIEAFGVEALHVTSLEAMQAEPEAVLGEVARFIGHDAPVTWAAEKSRENVSAARVRPLPLHGLIVRNPVSRFVRRTFVPKAWREAVKDRRRMTEKPQLHDVLQGALEARFTEDHADLVTLLPGNTRIQASYPFL